MSQRKFKLKCVICAHIETRHELPQGGDNPTCPECAGPMILEGIG